MAADLDWNLPLEASTAGHLSPIVYWNLAESSSKGAAAPRWILSELRTHFLACRRAKEKCARETASLLRVLDENHVDAMLLKGSVADWFVFDDPWSSMRNDVDILLRSRNSKGTDSKLVDGYLQTLHTPFECEARHHNIDVEGVLAVDFNSFWLRAKPTQLRGTPVFIPAPEEILWLACVSSYRKGLCHPRCLLEIRSIIEKYSILNGRGLAETARQSRSAAIVYASLYITKILTLTPSTEQARRLLKVGRGKRNSCSSLSEIALQMDCVPASYCTGSARP